MTRSRKRRMRTRRPRRQGGAADERLLGLSRNSVSSQMSLCDTLKSYL
jgi:hypothetical protein